MSFTNWQDLTTEELREAVRPETVAILPVAAIEQHGPHLPLATDAIINEGIVAAARAVAPAGQSVLVLPQISVGHSPEHTSFPGTLTVDAKTLLDLWTDVGRSVARAGVDKLIVLNSHGGQKALVDLVAVRLRAEVRLAVARASYFGFGMPAGLFDPQEVARGIHGGEVETSLMLHLAPSAVRRDQLADFPSSIEEYAESYEVLGIEKPVGIGWLAEDLNPLGVCGNAARADADRGAKYLSFVADRLVTLCAEFARAE
jgi:creatinine amidohydrolase